MFTAPLILAGLLGIGLPLWLHRVARADPQQHPFASLMFLEPSETQRTAQRTLRYWLLLALRIALLVLLVLAFAGPLVSSKVVPVATADARLHAIVLDTSFSMRGEGRWQQALEQVEAVIDAARPGDRLMLVAAAGRRIQVIQEAVTLSEAGLLRAALRRIEPGTDRLDYGLLMSTAQSWLGTPRLPAQLHLITDLQQSASPLRFADLQPPPATELKLHQVGEPAQRNTYIAHSDLSAQDAGTLAVKVRTTSTAAERRELTLSIDGKEVARRPVEFSAAPAALAVVDGEGGTAERAAPVREVASEFSGLGLTPGSHRLELALSPFDAWPQDDRYHSVVEHADPKVLLISRDPRGDDAAYFEAAIGSLTAPRLTVDKRAAKELEAQPLGDFSAVVVSDIAALSSEGLERLTHYVSAGGSVLMTMAGGSLTPRGKLLEGLRVGGVTNQQLKVSNVMDSHPILRQSQPWQRVRFLRQLRVEPAATDRVLLGLENGAPLLIERTVDAGKVLIFTAPLDREWNDLAIHPMFVQFTAGAARYLIGQDANATSTQVGAAVATGLTPASGGQIFDPQGKRVLQLGAAAAVERFEPDQTGFYEIRSRGTQRWLAVNVDPRESDLSRLSAASIQRWVALPAAPGAAVEASAQGADPEPAHRSLGYALLLIAAAFGLIELLLANHYLAVRREAGVVQ